MDLTLGLLRSPRSPSWPDHGGTTIRSDPGGMTDTSVSRPANGDCEGGEMNFDHPGGPLKFGGRPGSGMALIFAHLQLHEGAPVRSGRKYALRSDVMCRRLVAEG